MKNKGITPATLSAILDGDIDNAIVASTPGGIEAQEAEGQKSFVNSDTLPTKVLDYGDYKTKEILESVGVKFLGPVEGDVLFQNVELPEGWKKELTGHSMWSKLVDEKGRERAAIFYKAAFYDRRAHISLTQRYNLRSDYDRFDEKDEAVALVTDCGETIYTTPLIDFDDSVDKYGRLDQQDRIARSWLNEKYPEWQNPGDYWD